MLTPADPARSLFVRLLVGGLRVLVGLLAVLLRGRRMRRLQMVVRSGRVVRRRLVMALVGRMLRRRGHIKPTFPCLAGRPLRHGRNSKPSGQE